MFGKIKSKKAVIFFIIFSVIFTPMAVSDMRPEAADSEISDLQKQINDRKASISSSASKRKELENKIASLKNQQSDAMRDKKIYDDLVLTIENEVKETEALIENYKEYIKQEEEAIRRAQDDYDDSYSVFLKMIKLAYEEGDVDYLSMLLKSEDFTDFLTRVDIISNMLEYNKNVITKLQKSKETLESSKSSYEDMIAQQDDYINDLSQKSKDANTLRAQAEASIAQSNREIEANKALQAQLDKEAKDTQDEITRLSKELQAKQESQRKYVGGNMIWPVDSNRAISSGFGSRKSPITGRQEFHYGIDIPANYGASIYAANDGTVILAKYSSGYGNYIVIDHGGGKTTLYAHASSLVKKVGDKVAKGDTIAKVGSTGMSTGNHLHFEYAEDGERKNPALYVQRP